MCGGGAPSGDGGAAEARAREEARQAKISSGMSRINDTFSKFDDGFFDARRKAAEDYYLPQLEEQYGKANRDLTYALSRSGTLNSSIAGDQMGEAKRSYDRQRQAILDQALGVANQARGDVERNRSDLISQLNASADPEAAASGAAARAAMLGAMPTFSPLGQLFQNITSGLAGAAQGAQLAGANDGSGINIFGRGGSSSSRIVA